jgi:hypothetical protein
MKRLRIPGFALVAACFVLISGTPVADGQLHWLLRKEPIEVRLIALAVAYPKSSFFANDEVFVAEQELAKEESRFIKLVYDFLPYQSPLSSYGLDYSVVYHLHAVRDTSCDESLWEMRSLKSKEKRSATLDQDWRYAHDTPIADLDYRQARLRCYRATSDDFEKADREPTNELPY